MTATDLLKSNTTLSREKVSGYQFAEQTGGLRGKLLEQRATAWVKEIYQEVGSQVPIIDVGGIFTGEDAYSKIRAGASLNQVYIGMAYEGPDIAAAINKLLLKLMQHDGFSHISEAIGVDETS